MAANVGHAAGNSVRTPLPDDTRVVVLYVPDEQTLRQLAIALGEKSLTARLVIEDAGPYEGQAMALGVEPTTERARVQKVTSHLPLVR